MFSIMCSISMIFVCFLYRGKFATVVYRCAENVKSCKGVCSKIAIKCNAIKQNKPALVLLDLYVTF